MRRNNSARRKQKSKYNESWLLEVCMSEEWESDDPSNDILRIKKGK